MHKEKKYKRNCHNISKNIEIYSHEDIRGRRYAVWLTKY